MKKILLIVLFTTSVYAQSNWKFDAGMFTTPAMNMITFTRYSELSDGRSWYFSTGLPGIAVLGLAKDYKGGNGNLNHITGSIGIDPSVDGFFRVAWSKDAFVYENVTLSWGVSLGIASLSYGTRIIDDYDTEETGWEFETIFSTAGSSDAFLFLPLPMASLTYDFGK
jgi:hypothetical protein